MSELEVARVYEPDDDAIRSLLRLLAENGERPGSTGRSATDEGARRGSSNDVEPTPE